MRSPREEHQTERVGLVGSAAEAGTRRDLITLAAGGIVALGSGLVLPTAPDVEANKHAHRRRKRARRRRDQRPQSFLNPVTFHVQNQLSVPLDYQFWIQKDTDYLWYPRRSGNLEANPTHSSANKYVVQWTSAGPFDWPGGMLWIGAHGLMVSAVNVAFLAPMVTIGKNGNVQERCEDCGSDGWTNGTVLLDQRMTERSTEWREATTDITAYITVFRHDDHDGRKIYSITLDNRHP